MESNRICQEAEEVKGKTWARISNVVTMGKARQRRISRFRTGWFNQFQRAVGIGAITRCLVLEPGMIKAEEYCTLKCKIQIDRVVQIWGLDWLVCI